MAEWGDLFPAAFKIYIYLIKRIILSWFPQTRLSFPQSGIQAVLHPACTPGYHDLTVLPANTPHRHYAGNLPGKCEFP